MKKKTVQIASFLLAAAMLLPGAGQRARAAEETAGNIRVGLAFGSGALPGANLENSVGKGYRFGWYDDALNFQELGGTDELKISVVKTQNVWYGSIGVRMGYSDQFTSELGVGCYHLQLPASYASFEEARAAADAAGGFPSYMKGIYCVRLGAYLSWEEAQAALEGLGVEGAVVTGTSGSAVSVVRTGTASILFQFDGGADVPFGIMPDRDDGEKTVTWFAGNKYFGGFQYRRQGGDLTVVNVVDQEDYINCVISQEMSDSWPVETLKAQAVAARTYARMKMERSGHASQGFDICNTTDCQAYPGAGRIGDNTTRAAGETRGVCAWYNGGLAETYYFSSDGGATEDVKNVWGGSVGSLIGVPDPWEAEVADQIYNYTRTITYTKEQLEEKLRASGRDCAELVNVVVTPTALGNAKSVTFTDDLGKSWTISGDSARNFLGTGSVRYALAGEDLAVNDAGNTLATTAGAYAVDGSGDMLLLDGAPYVLTGSGVERLDTTAASGDTYTFRASGSGHNVGMSQWGAYAMGKAGKTYEEILNFYYTGITLK